LIAVSSNRLSFPGVHIRQLRLLCITALISSSNPFAKIRCVSPDKRSKAAATAATPLALARKNGPA
jgi:hypothetical protein